MVTFLACLSLFLFVCICALIVHRVPKISGIIHIVETNDQVTMTLDILSDPEALQEDGNLVVFRVQKNRG